MYECTQTGMPICRAMFLNDPDDPNLRPPTTVNQVLLSPYNLNDQYTYDTTHTYRDRDQFFVGKDLLVAPMVLERWESSSYKPGHQVHGASRPVYLPAGYDWYAFTGDFSGPANSDNNLPTTLHGILEAPTPGNYLANWSTGRLDLVPAYIRAGAIIPVRQLEQYVGELHDQGKKNYLTYNIYPGKDSSYLCYQDDHISMDAENSQAYRTTQIHHQQQGAGQEISLTRLHDGYPVPEEFYYIALLGRKQAPNSVTANGAPLSPVGTLQDLASSATNAYSFNAGQQTVFIKIFDRESSMKILAS
jgi:alpha-glucosidase